MGSIPRTPTFSTLAPTTTQGDMIYHNGTTNVRLPKGTASQEIRMNAGATAPEWYTPAAAASISTPKICYVEADGNDGTGAVGNPALPFLSATAAHDAGVTSGGAFVIEIGRGSFTLIKPTGISTNLRSINGRGGRDGGSHATVLTLSVQPTVVTNANGTNATNIAVGLNDMQVTINCNGGNIVDVSDAGTYTGGTAGSIEISGTAIVNASAIGGASDSNPTTSGDVIGGPGGGIVVINNSIAAIDVSQGVGNALGLEVPPTTSGTISLDGCYAVGATFGTVLPTTSDVGRTSYTGVALTPTGDKGGNAVW